MLKRTVRQKYVVPYEFLLLATQKLCFGTTIEHFIQQLYNTNCIQQQSQI